MGSIGGGGKGWVDGRGSRVRLAGSLFSAAAARNVVRVSAIALPGALLAACAQSSVVTRNSEFHGTSRQASLHPDRTASFVPHRRVPAAKNHTPLAAPQNAAETQPAAHARTSFYTER